MINSWTLHVRDFGKIESADIEVSPLTLFVGDNNSGKSYLMSLIYGLLNIDDFFDVFDDSSRSFQIVFDWIDTIIKNDKVIIEKEEFKVTNDIFLCLQVLINDYLQENSKKIIKNIFTDYINIGYIYISCKYQEFMNISLTYKNEISFDISNSNVSVEFLFGNQPLSCSYTFNTSLNNKKIICYNIISQMCKNMLRADFITNRMLYFIYEKVAYFPTSRTGFILAYKGLIRSTLEQVYGFDESFKVSIRLTKPIADFLIALSSISNDNYSPKYKDILDIINEKIINGNISISEAPTPDFYFKPQNSDIKLPMHISSGVVTELTPLILFLQYCRFQTLMIEEPEISLHPKLQVAMARVLINLYNSDCPVFISTHSETIIQHVNNMIKLNGNKDRENLMNRFGYTDKDLINPADIRMYQFDVDNETQKTTVKPLTCGKYGFEVPTFNDALDKLLHETSEFESD